MEKILVQIRQDMIFRSLSLTTNENWFEFVSQNDEMLYFSDQLPTRLGTKEPEFCHKHAVPTATAKKIQSQENCFGIPTPTLEPK